MCKLGDLEVEKLLGALIHYMKRGETDGGGLPPCNRPNTATILLREALVTRNVGAHILPDFRNESDQHTP